MQTSNKKIFDNLVSRTKIYLVIILKEKAKYQKHCKT